MPRTVDADEQQMSAGRLMLERQEKSAEDDAEATDAELTSVHEDERDDNEEDSDDDQADDDDDDEQPEEYTVEAIRAKRRNPVTNQVEYLIKWENYPESDNTWEPKENLQCPALLIAFNEANSARKSRYTRASALAETTNKEARESKASRHSAVITIDDENRSQSPEPESDPEPTEALAARAKPADQQPPLERIVSACVDDDQNVFCFIERKNSEKLDMVSISYLENQYPKELCMWYKEKLYHTIEDKRQA